MAYDDTQDIADFNPDVGQQQRAKLRKDMPRGTGTGQPDVEEGIGGEPVDAYTRAIQAATPGTVVRAVGQAIGLGPAAGATGEFGAGATGTFPPARAAGGVIGTAGAVDYSGATGRAAPPPVVPGGMPVPAFNAGPYGVFQGAADAIGAMRNRPIPDQPYGTIPVGPSAPAIAAAPEAAPSVGIPQSPGLTAGPPRPAVAAPATTAADVTQSVTVPRPVAAPVGPVMTDAERNNAPFHDAYVRIQAEKAAGNASQAQFFNDEAQRNQRLAAGPGYREVEAAKSAARLASFRATNGADMVLAGGNDAYAGERAGILANAGLAANRAANLEAQAQAAAAPGPRRDLVAEQEGQTRSIDATTGAQQTQAQAAKLNPLAVQQATQGVASGAIAQKSADIALQTHEHRLDLLKQLAAETDPAKRNRLEESVRVLDGKEKQQQFKAYTSGGGMNELGQVQPQYVHVVNNDTGAVQTIGGPTPDAGYTDGERRSMNGVTKEYDAKKKVWVTVKGHTG
jgi:hypothetical protein